MTDNYVDERGKFDSQSLLADNFIANLSDKGKSKLAKMDKKIEASNKIIKETSFINTEEVLIDLFEVRDGLIESFAQIGLTKSSESLVNSINKVSRCIRNIGGEVEDFDPFAHLSGLQSPNIVKNATRVVENTKEAYTLGEIKDALVKDDGKTISITFTGMKDGVAYKALGTIEAIKTWLGNEALEYIYSPGEGRLSVKALNDDGIWIDKSANYKISWELSELPMVQSSIENNTEIKEEVKKDTPNNIDDEDISDLQDAANVAGFFGANKD